MENVTASAHIKFGTHEGACSRSTLLQHDPGAKLPRLHQRFLVKKYVAQQNFCSRVCSLISNWFDMREQAPGANLLQEQAPWCELKFACRDMTCLQLANQIGLFFFHPQLIANSLSKKKLYYKTSNKILFTINLLLQKISLSKKMAAQEQLVPMPQSGCFIIQLPRRVLRVYWLGYLPGSVFQEQAPSCVPAFTSLCLPHQSSNVALAFAQNAFQESFIVGTKLFFTSRAIFAFSALSLILGQKQKTKTTNNDGTKSLLSKAIVYFTAKA